MAIRGVDHLASPEGKKFTPSSRMHVARWILNFVAHATTLRERKALHLLYNPEDRLDPGKR
jgi:hypothetical protein